MARQQKICIRVPVEWLSAMDKHRGEATRSIYVRKLLSRALRKSEDVDGRGVWDRVDYGLMRSDRAEAELRRRARNEKRRQQPRPPKLLPPPPVFVFHDNGIVGSPDLDIQATFCGLVREDGKYQAETTRYSEGMIREAVREALSTGSLSGERWRRFVARGERG